MFVLILSLFVQHSLLVNGFDMQYVKEGYFTNKAYKITADPVQQLYESEKNGKVLMYEAGKPEKINNCHFDTKKVFGVPRFKRLHSITISFIAPMKAMSLNFYDVGDENSLHASKQWIDIAAFNSTNHMVSHNQQHIKFGPQNDACIAKFPLTTSIAGANIMRVKISFGMMNSSGKFNLMSDAGFAMGHLVLHPV